MHLNQGSYQQNKEWSKPKPLNIHCRKPWKIVYWLSEIQAREAISEDMQTWEVQAQTEVTEKETVWQIRVSQFPEYVLKAKMVFGKCKLKYSMTLGLSLYMHAKKSYAPK